MSIALTLFLPHPANECHQGGPGLPLAIAQQRVGSRWKCHRWTSAPNQFAGIRRRKEQAGVDIAEPERTRDSGRRRWLVNDWHNGPCDEIPVFIQSYRDYRLNVQDPLCGLVGADAKIEVILEGTLMRLATGFWV